MATILSLINKFNNLKTDEVINKTFEETKENIADINRERMLDGVRSDGKIMPNYSIISTPIKLKDTGDFQKAIFSTIESDKILTTSSDYKTELLTKKYGENIFGLGYGYHNKYLNNYFYPLLQKKITNYIGLKFKGK